jgi:CheY-like chemotaxis protein
MDTSVAALDRVETTRRIRSLRAPSSHVPIVALIPQSTKSHCGAYLAVGIDGCVLKPIKGHELRAALVPFLSGAREEPVLRLVKG